MENESQILQPGTLLTDRYEIVTLIGRGAFGAVYKARQLHMNREVAIKVLPSSYFSMQNVVERFRREAKLASRLSHPNTITLFDYGRVDETLFIVMELLHGKDLADKISEGQKFPPERVVRICSQVLRSLREAHSYGIIHRDLKPENIFISQVGGEDDVVKVLDFGIAKFASPDLVLPVSSSRSGRHRQLTRSGSTIGTPAYMSPEQAAGDELNHQSDLYSLGVIMYELVSGRLPFPGEDMVKTMRSHLFDPVPPLHVRGITGTPLEDVIMRALEKDPKNRFPSAEEMLRALAGPSNEGSIRIAFDRTVIEPPHPSNATYAPNAADAAQSTSSLRDTEVMEQSFSGKLGELAAKGEGEAQNGEALNEVPHNGSEDLEGKQHDSLHPTSPEMTLQPVPEGEFSWEWDEEELPVKKRRGRKEKGSPNFVAAMIIFLAIVGVLAGLTYVAYQKGWLGGLHLSAETVSDPRTRTGERDASAGEDTSGASKGLEKGPEGKSESPEATESPSEGGGGGKETGSSEPSSE